MSRYLNGNNTDVITQMIEEIQDGLENISDEIGFLETIDWDEIFEFVPEDGIKSEIIDSLDAIRTVLYNISS
jgi:hypothetical protein